MKILKFELSRCRECKSRQRSQDGFDYCPFTENLEHIPTVGQGQTLKDAQDFPDFCPLEESTKTPWLPATAELLENDTRSVEEGKGWWWQRNTGNGNYMRLVKYISESNGEFMFEDVNSKRGFVHSSMSYVLFQPAQAPPKMEE